MAHLDLELEVELEIWLGVELGQQVHEAHGPGTGRLEHLLKQVQIQSYKYNVHEQFKIKTCQNVSRHREEQKHLEGKSAVIVFKTGTFC